MTKRPNSRANLDRAIERLFGNYEKTLETRSIMANAIVGQMLNGGVVKGGSGLKLRYGIRLTRATMDLDTACKGDLLEFIENLSQSLRGGWCGFSGTIIKRNPAKPRNVPPQYVMQPYAVRLVPDCPEAAWSHGAELTPRPRPYRPSAHRRTFASRFRQGCAALQKAVFVSANAAMATQSHQGNGLGDGVQ